jgi:UDP-GlcNAc:undecaprenyl-phosphate GlcNAc-1-phosphate transferase
MYIDILLIAKITIAFSVAIVLSFIVTPAVKSFAQKVGAIDVPKDARRMHDHPIPRLGGLAIFVAFILSVLLSAEINRQIQGILLGSVIIVIVGVIDDIVSLPALVKLVGQIVAALVAVYFGVIINVVSNPNVFSETDYIVLGSAAIPITVLWIVGVTNSVNLIDGLDGLAVGVSAIASITMMVISVVLEQSNVSIVLAALAGACVGFMPYNLNPAKIFMGDTGALLLGFVLSTVSIIGLFKFYAIITFVVPFLVLGLPIFDTTFAIIRRLAKGRNPMSPDRGHFHHRLIDMGLSQKQAVAILYLISGMLGVAAVLITTSGELKAVLLLLAFFVALVLGWFVKKSFSHEKQRDAARVGAQQFSSAEHVHQEEAAPVPQQDHTESNPHAEADHAEKRDADAEVPSERQSEHNEHN